MADREDASDDGEIVLNFSGKTESEHFENKSNLGLNPKSTKEITQPGACSARAKKNKAIALKNPRAQADYRIVVIKRFVATEEPRNIRFQADKECLEAMGDGILAAFESESGDLTDFPVCKLRDRMESLTGKGQRKPTDLSHFQNQQTDLLYEIIRRKDTLAGRADTLLFDKIDQSAVCFKCDYDTKQQFAGIQDLAIAVVARDLIDIAGGFIFMGPPYRWSNQLLWDIPKAVLENLFYKQPLDNLADDGTLVGDIFQVAPAGSFRKLENISGFSPVRNNELVLGGESADIPISTGMGVSFTFDKCTPTLREVLSSGDNPSLKTCHGFVAGIVDGESPGAVLLNVCLLLSKGNLPAHNKWSRLRQTGVLTTNLKADICPSWVVGTFLVLPITLHPLSGTIPEEEFTMGNAACAMDRDVFIAGHLDLIPGDVIQPAAVAQTAQNDLWRKRYEDNKYKSFALYSDYCFRGGAVTDPAFKAHAIWKRQFSETIQRVPHQRPRAELHRVEAFPPEMALSTIYASQRLLGSPSYGPFLYDLHAAVLRFAESKAKRVATGGKGSSCTITLSMPGNMLMQLVHKYATVSEIRFKEGIVEAVMEHFHHAEKLLGSKDGVINRGSRGIVQLYSPIIARWVLFHPRAGPEETAYIGTEGRAEIEFKKFVGKDRHGGELTGALSTEDLPMDDGGAGENGMGGAGT